MKKIFSLMSLIMLCLCSMGAETPTSLLEAYQIYASAAANGKTNATAELTLNMKNRVAIGTWQCTLVLPEGVTFQSATLLEARIPEGYNAEFTATPNADGTVSLYCEGEEGVALTGTEGAIATITVAIASDATVGDVIVIVKYTQLIEPNGTIHKDAKGQREFTWTIEQGEEPGLEGDLTGDGEVNIADAVVILDAMAIGEYDKAYDLNNDNEVNIADFVIILDIMAAQ